MPVYHNSDRLQTNLEQLFDQVASEDGEAVDSLVKSRLIIGIKTTEPQVEILVNGRKTPVDVSFNNRKLRPDLDITLSADVLHAILMGDISLKAAFTRGKLMIRGPFLKTFALEGLFRRGQELYPQIWENHSQT